MDLPVEPGRITQLWGPRDLVENCFHDLRGGGAGVPSALFMVTTKVSVSNTFKALQQHTRHGDLVVILHLGAVDHAGWANFLPLFKVHLKSQQASFLALFESPEDRPEPYSKVWQYAAAIRGELVLDPLGWNAILTKDLRRRVQAPHP